MDLWEYDLKDRQARLLVDSRAPRASGRGTLRRKRSSRRERQRTAALSGILEYSFAPSGRALLFPLDGKLYYYDLEKPASQAVPGSHRADAFATDATRFRRATAMSPMSATRISMSMTSPRGPTGH